MQNAVTNARASIEVATVADAYAWLKEQPAFEGAADVLEA